MAPPVSAAPAVQQERAAVRGVQRPPRGRRDGRDPLARRRHAAACALPRRPGASSAASCCSASTRGPSPPSWRALEAQLASARSAAALAASELARTKKLLEQKAVSQQEADQADAAARNAQAAVGAPPRRRCAACEAERRVHADPRADRRPRLARQRHRRQPGRRGRPGADHAGRAGQGARLVRRQRAGLPARPRVGQGRRHAEGRDGPGRRDRLPARRHASTSSTTASTRPPARSACAPCSTTRTARFTPGLFARAAPGQRHRRGAVLTPDRAIGTDQTKRYVFVVGADNVAQFREVQARRADRRHARRHAPG